MMHHDPWWFPGGSRTCFVRERGMRMPPERIKGSPLATMVGGAPAQRHRVGSAASPSAINRGDRLSRVWEEKSWGVDPRAVRLWALPHQTAARCARVLVPPLLVPGRSLGENTLKSEGKSAKSHTLTRALAHI